MHHARVAEEDEAERLRAIEGCDILELRRHVRSLGRRVLELHDQLSASEQLQTQRDELRAFVVHDLKNSLATILPNAEYLLESEKLSDEERLAATDLRRSAENMARMVVDWLDPRGAHAGALSPRLADVSLVALLRDLERTMARRFRESEQKLVLTTPTAHDVVRADGDLLRRVLENLLDNALKYGRATDGTVTVRVTPPRDGFIEIAVSDEGVGIPLERRERIFERDAGRDGDATMHGRSSYGLGLAFCRTAIEAHGGEIWVDGRSPRGSSFHVLVPTPQCEASSAAPLGEPTPVGPSQPLPALQRTFPQDPLVPLFTSQYAFV